MPRNSPAAATRTLALVLLTACAGGSGSGSPHLRPERLVHVRLDSVVPRQVILALTDERRPRPANSDTMLTEVDHAVRSILTEAGIAVDTGAPNSLRIKLTYPDSAWHGMKPEDCIVMSAVLRLRTGSHATSGATSCLTYKNLYGMRVASNPTGVYEDVVNTTLKGLDEVLGKHASP
jgi:hypothetical protein